MFKFVSIGLLVAATFIQQKGSAQVSAGTFSLVAKTSTGDSAKPVVKSVIKPYKEVITANAKTVRGLFIVHKVEEKYYFEIPTSVMNKDMLAVTRLSKSSAGFRAGTFGYSGDELAESVIRFEKGPNNKVFIRTVSYIDYSKDSASPMYTAVQNSNVQPIAMAFDIKTVSPFGNQPVIDVTDFVNGDNDLLYFDARTKSSLKLGALATDKSYIDTIKTYPKNTEIRSVETYTRANTTNATLELNVSVILLPENQMKPRLYDSRIGYFSGGYYDYDADPQGVKATYLIRRWRLEPKAEDVDKYLAGQLVEPKKQIVIYIDPATPKKWVPYLMQGVNDWQAAFEKAGFKNAVVAKEAPSKQEDSTWSIEDARYSAIVYKPSPIANASGPHVADPRTGEILETHINWYHNVMKLLQTWYFVQCGAVDPRAHKLELEDSLMGQLIRFVSSHEVGHTLGLRHNFGSSSSVPVEKLRDKKWVEANGHTPSIMDYARFNYVAQPEDNIGEKGLFPRIGDYDKWAIEWGYKWLPQFATPKDEMAFLNKLSIEKLKDKRNFFGSEMAGGDPRSQSEDLGDDAMKANTYGIKNLKVIMKNLPEWTKRPNEGYADLNMMYTEIRGQYTRYIMHVAKYMGGTYQTPKTVEQSGTLYGFVPASLQHEAMLFFKDQVFTTPTWLINNDILNNVGLRSTEVVTAAQVVVLDKLIHGFMMERLIQAEAMEGKSAYKQTDLFNDLKACIWSELSTKKPLDIYRRNLQKLYIEKFNVLLNPKIKHTNELTSLNLDDILPQGLAIRNSDNYATVKAHLLQLQKEIKAAIPTAKDEVTRNHFSYMAHRITEIFEPKSDNIY